MRGVQIVRAAPAWGIGGQVDFVFGTIDKRNVDVLKVFSRRVMNDRRGVSAAWRNGLHQIWRRMPETNHRRQEGRRKGAAPDRIHEIVSLRYSPYADAQSALRANSVARRPAAEQHTLSFWRRYFRAGNTQLKKLILFGLDRDPTDRDLLDSLAFLHSFVPTPKELLTRYKLACDQESDPQIP